MNNFENEYKKEILSDLPDLWSRIEAALPAQEATPVAEVKNETVAKPKKKKFRISPVVWVVVPMAAIAFILIVPTAIAGLIGASIIGNGSKTAEAQPNMMALAPTIASDDAEYNANGGSAFVTQEEEFEEIEGLSNPADYSNGNVIEDAPMMEASSTVGADYSSEKFNHEYDYTTNYDNVTMRTVAKDIKVKVNDFYTNEQGLNAELTVVEPGRYFLVDDVKYEFFVDENLCAHIHNDQDDLVIGEIYNADIFLATDGTKVEWWEFIVKE